MRVFKWTVVFLIAFMFAWVLIFTFTQEPFKTLVPGRVLTYQTPAIPIYAYVAGAFAVGLLIGFITAIYYYVLMQSQIHRKSKQVRKLEQELADANMEIERLQVRREEPASSSEQALAGGEEIN